MIIRERKREFKAYTLIEVLLAAVIGAVFSALIAQSVITVSSVTRDVTREAVSDSGARSVLDLASRYIRGAVDPATCQYPVNTQSAKDCYQFSNRTNIYTNEPVSSFIYTGKNEAIFFGYTSTQGGSDLFAPPDLVQIVGTPFDISTKNPGRICVKVWKATPNSDIVTSWTNVYDEASFRNYESTTSASNIKTVLCHQLLQGDTSSAEILSTRGCDTNNSDFTHPGFFKFYNSTGVETSAKNQIAYVSINVRTYVSNASKAQCPITFKNSEILLSVNGKLF